jgi:OmpA family protein
MKTLWITGTITAALLVCSASSVADSLGADKWYVGASLGYSSNDANQQDYLKNVNDGSLSNVDYDDGSLGGKIWLGYRITEMFFVEAGYTNLGKSKFRSTSDGTGSYPAGKADLDIKVDGFTAAAGILLPLGDKLHVHTRVGAFAWNADFDANVTASSAHDSENDTDIFAAIGVSTRLDHFDIVLSYDAFFLDPYYGLVSIGIQRSF